MAVLWGGTHVGLNMVRHTASTTVDPCLPAKMERWAREERPKPMEKETQGIAPRMLP